MRDFVDDNMIALVMGTHAQAHFQLRPRLRRGASAFRGKEENQTLGPVFFEETNPFLGHHMVGM